MKKLLGLLLLLFAAPAAAGFFGGGGIQPTSTNTISGQWTFNHNLGVGAAAPYNYQVLFSTSQTVTAHFGVKNSDSGATAYTFFHVLNDNTALDDVGLLRVGNGNTAYAGASSLNLFAGSGAAPIGVVTNNLLRMFVGSGGQVEVGATKNPTYALDVTAGSIRPAGFIIETSSAITINDNGVGSSAATYTLTPQTGHVKITCSDADGCTVTLGEGNAADGERLTVTNVGTNVANFADTSGVTDTAGAFAAGQWDAITYLYVTDRWVETARSNN